MSSLIFPKWLEKKWEKERDAELIKQECIEYHKNHKACPECGSDSIWSTTGPWGPTPYQRGGPDRNSAKCTNCQWVGVVDDLVPIVEESRIVYNLEGNRCVARMEPLEDTKESLICP